MKTWIYSESGKVFVEYIETGERMEHTLFAPTDIRSIVETYAGIRMDFVYTKREIIEKYKEAGDILGTSLKNFRRMLKGAIYRTYVADNEQIIKRFCYYPKPSSRSKKDKVGWELDLPKVLITNKNINYIKGYQNDGNDHIAGIGWLLGMNSKDAKIMLGKSLWKRICANSKTRNDMIVKIASGAYTESDSSYDAVDLIRFLSRTRTTILKRVPWSLLMRVFATEQEAGYEGIIPKILHKENCAMSKIDTMELDRACSVISDTKRMIGNNFNNKWGLNRIELEHNKAIEELKKKRYSKENFSIVDILENKFDRNGHTAELVPSAYELQKLGTEQNHCVGSYHSLVNNGSYVVYKITSNQGEVSTLGISLSDLHTQHYGRFNAIIKDKSTIRFVEYISRKVIRYIKKEDIKKKLNHIRKDNESSRIDFDNEIPF